MSFTSTSINDNSLRRLDEYQSSLPHSQFLQSSAWARFKEQSGKRIIILEKAGTAMFAIMNRLPFGKTYWYIPRCPITENDQLNAVKRFFAEHDPKCLFIRFEPTAAQGAIDAVKTIDIQPSRTLLFDLTRPENELLAGMHQKTRYNIRLAEKKGVTIKKGAEHIDGFIQLMAETGERDKFRLHEAEYYRSMVTTKTAELVTAWYGDKMLAGALIAHFGDTATYAHGASSSRDRSFMAPYALHWEIIKQAKADSYDWYDWHGIDEKKWPGVTRFKKGFGGEEITYPGTFDAPLAPLGYRGYTILRSLRRIF